MFIQTAFGADKIFVEISEPYDYENFIAAVAEEFNINVEEVVVCVNGTKVKKTQFRSIVLQYFTIPTFQIDITIKDTAQSVASASTVSSTLYTTESLNLCESDPKLLHSGAILIATSIPDEDTIRSLVSIKPILNEFLSGKHLQNKDRVKIAKAVIDECLKDIPERILNREDFQLLAECIVSVFTSEVVSAYYIPSGTGCPARGKLWSAYNNKRTILSVNGIIQRRSKPTLKRKSSTSCISPVETVVESIQYLHQNSSDWPIVISKWSETHNFRMSELKSKISTYDYINKYPGLQGKRGIELVAIDVNILYPSFMNVENWLTLYTKVLSRARNLRDKQVCDLILEIDDSSDERFRAQLSLLLVPYILPHCGKRSERKGGIATKYEIQQRFVKEYKTITELKEDTEITDLQIKFVKSKEAVHYAEFIIAGYVFKCSDLLEAVHIGFSYIMALNVVYPKICTHVWQFVQLSIFQIELSDIKVPNIETIINDLFKEV